MIQCPKEVMHVFDNEGETVDRYTIVILYEDGESYVVASSPKPTHPMGVWSSGEGYITASDLTEEDTHIGKEIYWEDLPTEVQECVCNNFNNLTFEANELELIKLDDREKENHIFVGTCSSTLNKEDGEAYYLPSGFYQIVGTEEYFIIDITDLREYSLGELKSIYKNFQDKNSLFDSIQKIREEKEQALIDAHEKRIDDEIEKFKSKIGSELKFVGKSADIEDLYFKKLKIVKAQFSDYALFVDNKYDADIFTSKDDDNNIVYSAHDGADGYGWYNTIHEAVKSYMDCNYRYPNHYGEHTKEYEVECTNCGDGGCIHCEPHRFI